MMSATLMDLILEETSSCSSSLDSSERFSSSTMKLSFSESSSEKSSSGCLSRDCIKADSSSPPYFSAMIDRPSTPSSSLTPSLSLRSIIKSASIFPSFTSVIRRVPVFPKRISPKLNSCYSILTLGIEVLA